MINIIRKEKSEQPEKNMLKDAYFNDRVKTFKGIGCKEPTMYIFSCTRCGTECSGTDMNGLKDAFDYYLITDYILCEKCVEEIEHMKENPYKVRIEIRYAHEHGDVLSVIEDVKPTMNDVDDFIVKKEKEFVEHALGMGYMIKDRKYYIEYIPYAERRL